ncbi:MAG: hypothetical protein ACRESZ_04440, partial [Methylococcales bacterium]
MKRPVAIFGRFLAHCWRGQGGVESSFFWAADPKSKEFLISKILQLNRHVGRACPGRDCRGIADIQNTGMCLGLCHPWLLDSLRALR